LLIKRLGKESVLLLAWQGECHGAQSKGNNGNRGIEHFHGYDSGLIKGVSAGSFRCHDLLNPLQPGRLSCCMGSE